MQTLTLQAANANSAEEHLEALSEHELEPSGPGSKRQQR